MPKSYLWQWKKLKKISEDKIDYIMKKPLPGFREAAFSISAYNCL